jgi:eukaryotic-like serine/threonine-protein kinase
LVQPPEAASDRDGLRFRESASERIQQPWELLLERAEKASLSDSFNPAGLATVVLDHTLAHDVAYPEAMTVLGPRRAVAWASRLEGERLAQFLQRRSERGGSRMPVAEALALLEPAARAFAVAHAQKVAHRDVKPANLFLTDVAGTRTLKVLDFGIAKVLANHPTFTEALAATRQGPSAFTPRYGAPEQFNKARGATGPWTDVFALALIFVELVTGKKALEGDDPTQLYIASADPSLRPTLRARGIDDAPAAVERVLDKALAIEPKHRYPSAGDFWYALVAAARGEAAARAHAAPQPGGDASLTTAEFAAARKLDVVGRVSLTRGSLDTSGKW